VEHYVLNLGAGVQSTALYLMALDGKLRIDLAIFADTQDEPSSVYKHLHWLRSLAGPPIWVRTAGKLGDDLVAGIDGRGNRFVSIPAFTRNEQGKVGMVRRQCTKTYKIEVCERAIRRELLGLAPRKRVPKGTVVHQFFGISTDEAARAVRAARRFEKVKWSVPHWPLIEMGMSRKDCIEYLRGRVPHPVPKSACTFCPYRTNQEWARMRREAPEDFARAVEVDEALRRPESICTRGFKQALFVHRTCVPLQMIDFDAAAPNTIDPMSVGECQGMCGL
jgi:hypothetical protein